METSLEWQLKLIRWDFFATLTWEDVDTTTPSSRRKHVDRWMDRWCAHIMGLKSLHIAFVIRWERGEIGDRPHCHLLISRVPSRHISLTTAFRMKGMWEHRHPCTCENGHIECCNHGIAQVRLYDPSAGGVAYMLKGKFGSEWAQGANAYELRKFDSRDVDALDISPRAWQEMVQARTVARRMSPVH
jgi:hypothetical protein